MAKSFISKKGAKNLPGTATDAVLRTGGAVGAAFGIEKMQAGIPAIPEKFHAPIVWGLGVAGEAFLESPTAKKICQGIQAGAGLKAVGDTIMSGSKDKLGLSGTDDEVIADLSVPEYERVLKAEREASMKGIDDPDYFSTLNPQPSAGGGGAAIPYVYNGAQVSGLPQEEPDFSNIPV